MIDISISDKELDPLAAEGFCQTEEAGGMVVFIGSTREQTAGKSVVRLEFEAYKPMAVKEMRKIAETLMEKWGVIRVSIHHRVGIVLPGQVAVVIAVAAPHRAEAFEACRYAIDTLKETVPIWKKEIFQDGSIWVAAHP